MFQSSHKVQRFDQACWKSYLVRCRTQLELILELDEWRHKFFLHALQVLIKILLQANMTYMSVAADKTAKPLRRPMTFKRMRLAFVVAVAEKFCLKRRSSVRE